MSTQIAELERAAPRVREATPPVFDDTFQNEERTTNPVRGIVNAVVISVPVWAAVGFAIYLFK